jgi:archaetidylinositol phosphate synthase
MTPRRSNEGYLAKPEAVALDWMVRRVPAAISPDHLSFMGLVGALMAALGFALALTHPAFPIVAILGLAVNWVGDSLDGRLARLRRIERPHTGFSLDNGLDMVSYLMLTIGFSLSGLVSVAIPFILLSLHLMLSNLATARLAVTGVHQLDIGGVGTTELRVVFAILALQLLLIPSFMIFRWPVVDLNTIEVLSVVLAMGMATSFVRTLISDVTNSSRLDQ